MPVPPSLAVLVGPAADGLVRAALDPLDARLCALRVTGAQVQPGGAAVVRYTAEVGYPGGRRGRVTLAAATGERIPAGAAVLTGTVGGETLEVGLWAWPRDPALPGLARVTDPDALATLLAEAGIPRSEPADVRVIGYRPARRAVLEVRAGDRTVFVKAVRPGALDALRARHELLAPLLPVPPVLAATGDGLLLIPALPGTPLRTLLRDEGPLPGPAELDALLDRLPAAVADLPPRRPRGDHLGRLEHFAGVLAATAVDAAGARPLLARLERRIASADAGEHPLVPVHGDFYSAQLLAADGAVTGLLDLDTVGAGHWIDEWATLLAHLSVLAAEDPGAARAGRYGADLLRYAEDRWARDQLRPRIAAALVGLATGPFRVQQPGWPDVTRARLALAERWLAGAGRPA